MSRKTGTDAVNYPYLSRADKLKFSFPCLGPAVFRILNTTEPGRSIVSEYSVDKDEVPRIPGRCCVLEFRHTGTGTQASVEKVAFKDETKLRDYLESHVPKNGSPIASECSHRLFILEDLSPEYVELLGDHLDVDPTVFAAQMDTWRYASANTISQRTLPSLRNPVQSFTVRYPELRIGDGSLDEWRWTFAANRRNIDPWLQVPGSRIKIKESIALIRRCMSFWVDNPHGKSGRWNGLLLVDPPIDSVKIPNLRPGSYRVLKSQTSTSGYEPSHQWSRPYQNGHPDPISADQATKFTASYRRTHSISDKPAWRHKQSLFDEAILYWTHESHAATILSAIQTPVNTTQHVLRIAAYTWTSALELILLTLNQAEFMAHEERTPHRYNNTTTSNPSSLFPAAVDNNKWKQEIARLYNSILVLNTFRRRLAFFEDDIDRVLEQLDANSAPDPSSPAPTTLAAARKDFLALSTRIRLYKSRVDALASSTDEIVSLRSAAKGLDDGAFNLRIAVFAATVLPATLVAALLSMADGFKPGDERFWIFWAVAVPLTGGMVVLVVGWERSWRGVGDVVRGLRGRGGKGEMGKGSGKGYAA